MKYIYKHTYVFTLDLKYIMESKGIIIIGMFILFFLFKIFFFFKVGGFRAQCGTWTHDLEVKIWAVIKSRTQLTEQPRHPMFLTFWVRTILMSHLHSVSNKSRIKYVISSQQNLRIITGERGLWGLKAK